MKMQYFGEDLMEVSLKNREWTLASKTIIIAVLLILRRF